MYYRLGNKLLSDTTWLSTTLKPYTLFCEPWNYLAAYSSRQPARMVNRCSNHAILSTKHFVISAKRFLPRQMKMLDRTTVLLEQLKPVPVYHKCYCQIIGHHLEK